MPDDETLPIDETTPPPPEEPSELEPETTHTVPEGDVSVVVEPGASVTVSAPPTAPLNTPEIAPDVPMVIPDDDDGPGE